MGSIQNKFNKEKITITQFTAKEAKLFEKYYGKIGLENNEDFWKDVYDNLSGEIVPLPVNYNPLTYRLVMDTLDCAGGECSACCHYYVITIHKADVTRLLKVMTQEELDKIIKMGDNGAYIDGTNGCPLLVNNLCSVYEHRPDVCYMYPIQESISGMYQGKQMRQMTIKILCKKTVNVIRQIVTESVKQGGFLLPNLQIIKGG